MLCYHHFHMRQHQNPLFQVNFGSDFTHITYSVFKACAACMAKHRRRIAFTCHHFHSLALTQITVQLFHLYSSLTFQNLSIAKCLKNL